MSAPPIVAKNRGACRASGFTLIELMITVAIVALLATIAYPAYTDAVLKGKRAEGRTALLDLMQQEERYFSQNNIYVAFEASTSSSVAPFKRTSGDGSAAKAAYNLTARTCDAGTLRECVRVVATPLFTDAAAGSLWVESSGRKSCTVEGSTVCWK